MELQITVRQYLETLKETDPHALIKLIWLDYDQDEHSYNMWVESPFVNCLFMDVEHTLSHLINYYEWIGDMPIKGMAEYYNWAKLSKVMQREIRIQF